MVSVVEEQENFSSDTEDGLSCDQNSQKKFNELREEIVNAMESFNEVDLSAKIEEARSLGRRY
jgi:hypothetical protein